jgi:phage baseplate assembly protein W
MAVNISNFTVLTKGKQFILNGNFQWDFDALSNSVEGVLQNVYNIIVTPLGSQPLFRSFGTDWSLIDQPGNLGTLQSRTAILLSLGRWEPRASVAKMIFSMNTVAVMKGTYSLYLELNIDLTAPIHQILFATPSTTTTWVLDSAFGSIPVAQQENLLV